MVFQWLRICLAMQGTKVQSLVKELRFHMPWNNKAHRPQLLSLCTTTRESAPQRKILYGATWILTVQLSLMHQIYK